MHRIHGTIQGVAPILFNRLTDSQMENLDTGLSSKPATVEDRIEEAKQKCYQDVQGLYCPRWNFKRVLLDGARLTGEKINKQRLTQLISAAVFLDGEPRFNRTEPDFIHEHWGRIPPRTGKAVILRRPALETGWELTFGLVLTEPIPEAPIRRALEVAGLRVGMGSWRPEYGRFIVLDWKPDGALLAKRLPKPERKRKTQG